MKFKRAIAMGAAVAVLVGSALSVSAAEKLSSDDVKALKESGKVDLIIDVDAYKTAYGDLEAAFGDDMDAYIKHYLTAGIYEGRTKGVLFDPLAYAEAYGDVKAAFGNDIAAIVNHYVTFGVAESRTVGTANGYVDIATAEKNGVGIPRSFRANSYVSNVAGNEAAGNSYTATAMSSSYSGNVTEGSVNSNAAESGYAGNVVYGSNNSAAGSNSAEVSQGYHHTTSIYSNDEKTLLRVEYYDENNKLSQFSSVTYTDSSTNSYKEDIYHYDEEKDEIILDRTDTYVNGALSSSENY